MLFKKGVISFFVAMSWTFISVLSKSDEPIVKYSIFDFEQKLLEKLVRLEMKMESLEHKMDKLDGSVASSVEEAERRIGKIENSIREDWFLEKQRLLTKLDIEKEKSREIISSQLADVNCAFDNMSSAILDSRRIQNEVELVRLNVKAEVTNLTEQLEKANGFMRSYTTEKVVFKAGFLKKDTGMKGETLIFTTVLLNEGMAYDASTGIFTAPKSGLYMFTVMMCVESGQFVQLEINAAGRGIGWLRLKNADSEDRICVSGDGVAILSKGDTVYVKCTDTSSTGDVLYNTETINSFSGILVHLSS